MEKVTTTVLPFGKAPPMNIPSSEGMVCAVPEETVWAKPLLFTQQTFCPATIADFSFSPSCTTVPLNTVVTWTNNGPTAHTTTSDVAGQWDSGQMAATNTYPHTFNSAGTFAYHCTNHPSMMATIVVTP